MGKVEGRTVVTFGLRVTVKPKFFEGCSGFCRKAEFLEDSGLGGGEKSGRGVANMHEATPCCIIVLDISHSLSLSLFLQEPLVTSTHRSITEAMSSTSDKAATSQPKVEKAALLDDEGDLTAKVSLLCSGRNPCASSSLQLTSTFFSTLRKFEAALIRIFARFSKSYRKRHPDVQAAGSSPSASLQRPDAADVLTEADLDSFSTVTNGAALPEESKNEIKEFLDTDEDDNLTFRGFVEMYHLQSDNEPEETWKDLGKLGFDHQLEYIGDSKESSDDKSDAKVKETLEATETRSEDSKAETS